MASLDWDKIGAKQKYKSVTAIIRHNSKDTREQSVTHMNKHINSELTQYNQSLDGLSYEERCERYHARIAELDRQPKANKRNDRVTAIALETAVPEKLPPEQQTEWCRRVYDILSDYFGEENVIYGDIHADEIHDYIDTRTNTWAKSRVHMHVGVIPVDENGRLNAKKAETRENMVMLNEKIEQMTEQEYGVKWLTGEKRKGKDVDDLKNVSEKVLRERERTLQEREQVLRANQIAQQVREDALRARESDLRERVRNESIDSSYRLYDVVSSLSELAGNDGKIMYEKLNKAYKDAQNQSEVYYKRMCKTFDCIPPMKPDKTSERVRALYGVYSADVVDYNAGYLSETVADKPPEV